MLVELALAADKGVGRYRKLAPTCDGDGVYRVGARLKNFVPFTKDQQMPIILPPNHQLTLLIMRMPTSSVILDLTVPYVDLGTMATGLSELAILPRQ